MPEATGAAQEPNAISADDGVPRRESLDLELAKGHRLLHYRLVEKIGEGGMGVVWKAVDTTLDREVAIKILPDTVATDGDRLARFAREARLLASLNHPNVAAVYGLHETEGLRFLAMELAGGESLADRLSRGPMSLEESLGAARQVARALEAAHANGVIHRDLKPANVHLTADGKVKVLDFGLAKALDVTAVSGSGDPALSPTMTTAGTVAGVILGTAAYMSPEQARGRGTDRRGDIWALGCMLFEMLTGRRLFHGETISDTLAAVLRAEPDWSSLPEDAPAGIVRLLHRCLERNPDRRLHDAADARIEIEDAIAGVVEPGAPATGSATGGRTRMPWVLAAVCAAIALVSLIALSLRSGPVSFDPLYVSISVPPEFDLVQASAGDLIPAISPDGERLAFVARSVDTIRLYIRNLTGSEIVPIPESEGASNPFFSPDGQWVAFNAQGQLKKVSVQGGTPVALCAVPSFRGGTWADQDTIVFAPTYDSGLWRISAEGGEPELLTSPDASKNERTHRWPDSFPGGRAVVFTIGTLDNPGYYDDATIAVYDLTTGGIQVILEGGSIARHAPGNRLVYSREGKLLAVPFDSERLRVTGPPSQILSGVAREATSGAAHFGVARNGTLMFMPAGPESLPRRLIWIDREGRTESVVETARPFLSPRLSPDGRRVAFGVGPGLGDGDIWVYDFAKAALTRFTFDGSSLAPIWTPDGKRIAYGVTKGGAEGGAWRPSDGSSEGEVLFRHAGRYAAMLDAWIPGTDRFVYSRSGGRGGSDLMVVTVGNEEPEPLLEGPYKEGAASFSPDGRWMAYGTDETGRFEVYVRPYPGPGGKFQISTDGGRGPIWSEDGREIFYSHGDRILSVPVETRPTFSAGVPEEILRYDFERGYGPWPDYDVSPDGQRFLLIERPADDPRPRRVDLILSFDWEGATSAS